MERGYLYCLSKNDKGYSGTFSKIDKEIKVDFPLVKNSDTWGRWKYKNNCLVYHSNTGTERYRMSFNRITERNFLGWIEQLMYKVWITPEDIWNFIHAVTELNPDICKKARGLN